MYIYIELKKRSILQMLVHVHDSIFSNIFKRIDAKAKISHGEPLCYNKHGINDRNKLFSCLTYYDFLLLKSGRLSCIYSTLDKHKCLAPMAGQ